MFFDRLKQVCQDFAATHKGGGRMDGERRNTLLLAMITVKGGNSNAWHGAQRILDIEGVKGKERTDMMREFWSRRKASVAAKRKEMPK